MSPFQGGTGNKLKETRKKGGRKRTLGPGKKTLKNFAVGLVRLCLESRKPLLKLNVNLKKENIDVPCML